MHHRRIFPIKEYEQRRQHRHHGERAEQEPRACDHAELAQAAEVGEDRAEEDGRRARGARERARPDVAHGHRDRLGGGTRAAVLAVAAHDMDAVVEPRADEDEHEDRREQVEMPDKQRRGAVGPAGRDAEGEHGE